MSVQSQMTGQEQRSTIDGTELHERWGLVKTAIADLLKAYNSIGDSEDDRLEDICEYFEQKIDYDSPLAIN